MKKLLVLTHEQCEAAVVRLYDAYRTFGGKKAPAVFGVPRGGIPVAYLMRIHRATISPTPQLADLIVDDLVDSGKTKAHYTEIAPNIPFMAMADYLIKDKQQDEWIVFPWEQDGEDKSATDIPVRLLQYIGEDPNRPGLLETPQRVLKAWKEWSAGYGMNPKDVFKTFEDGAEKYDEMVWVSDLPFYSHCEHHLAPFFGTATIAYVPEKKILGLSKFGRLLEVFSRRLQVQERLTVQIADSIMEHLSPRGVGILIKARHLCMESRGLNRQGHSTITSALRGVFVEDKVRAEFLAIANK